MDGKFKLTLITIQYKKYTAKLPVSAFMIRMEGLSNYDQRKTALKSYRFMTFVTAHLPQYICCFEIAAIDGVSCRLCCFYSEGAAFNVDDVKIIKHICLS